jgi:uncharacterized damage-inducible protein DinB
MLIQTDILRDCAALLRQGSRVINEIQDDVFVATTPISPRGSIAAHFRHILDFYDCFLTGFEQLRIDYNQRERDPLLERKRSHALQKIEQTVGRLERLRMTESSQHVLVSMENSSSWSRSSVLRELDFLLSHTIHHYSLIAILLRIHEINPGEEFGVAPSTLNYWKQELVCAQ